MCRRSNVVASLVLAAGMVGSVWAGPGPVGWWKFDHGSGSTAYDSSGNNFHGSISDSYTWIPGYVGPYALDFASGYVSISDNALLRPNRLTVSVWVNLPGPQENMTRLLVKGDDNKETYNFQWGGYVLNFIMNANDHNVKLANPLWPDEWIHLGAVYDGNAMSLYVNGEFDNSRTTGEFTPLQSGGPLAIAARGPDYDRRMMGSLDDVRIYDYNMTEAQIQEVYFEVRDPSGAQWPFPKDMDEGVYPDVVLSWAPGLNALSHEVYLGTDCNDVNDADSTWPVGTSVYKGSIDVNYYDPPALLEFGGSYCWRIDEVAGSGRSKGVVWSFTVDDGKARSPDPSNNGYAPLDAVLSWTAAPLASLHDVYFGTDSDAVNSADKGSDEYKVSTSDANYDPGALSDGTDYYWRIDEVIAGMPVKGDLWLFSTTSGLHLKVDLGLPTCESTPNDTNVVPGTVKEGWWGRVFWGDTDMYMHDFAWEDGSRAPDPPNTPGIDGSGVHFALDSATGDGGYHVHGMCRDNLGGGGCPSGSPVGEPIANGWFHNIDWGGECTGDIHMRITGLPAGEYVLVSYHNHWEPCSQETRNCLDCYSNMPPMTGVYARSLPVAGLPGCGVAWSGTGTGVTPIQDAYDVDVTSVTSDDEVSTSMIRFHTDGSDVLVVYDGGDNTYPDPARPGREGSKGILNAFEIIKVGSDPKTAWNPFPVDEANGVDPNVALSWKAGSQAVSHDVYFGTSYVAVSDADTSSPEFKGNQAVGNETYDIGDLPDLGATCYWRIDEVNDANIWKGDVWSFTVLDHFVVDDFDDYTEIELIDTWIDGWVTGDNGAVVWLGEPPEPVRGEQSLLYDFDNSGARNGYYSQAYRDINEPNDWTMFGAKALKLWFYGDPINTLVDTDYFCVGVEDTSGSGSYSEVRYGDSNDMNDLMVAEWHEWNIDLQALGGGSLNLEDVNKLYIIIGDKQNPVAGGGGGVYIDDIWLFGAPSAVYPECWDYLTQCHGDCDNSGDVKGSDFLALKNSWYKVYPDAAYDPCADFDRDGQVKGSDFLILKNNWYQTVAGDCTPGDPYGIYE
ncbi:MAG: LamG-like jellyroll fold domain-containing protein [Planctomycetota bacterium]